MANYKSSVPLSDLANISDDQLRRRLESEFSYACGPITSTTKSVYLKKLQEFLNCSTGQSALGKISTGRSAAAKCKIRTQAISGVMSPASPRQARNQATPQSYPANPLVYPANPLVYEANQLGSTFCILFGCTLILAIVLSSVDLLCGLYSSGGSANFRSAVIDLTSPKPFTCQAKEFVLKAVRYFCFLAPSVALVLVYLIYSRFREEQLKKRELQFNLIQKTIELLQSSDQPPSLPIRFIRDTLLSPQQRESPFYLEVWDQVVNFIENNESRVKSRLENFDGEDYKTWKWAAKVNQSQFFE